MTKISADHSREIGFQNPLKGGWGYQKFRLYIGGVSLTLRDKLRYVGGGG